MIKEMFGVTETESDEKAKKTKFHFQICGWIGPIIIAAGLIFPFVDKWEVQLAIFEILEIHSFRDFISTALFFVLFPIAIASYLYLLDMPKSAWVFSAVGTIVFLIMTFSGLHLSIDVLGTGFWLLADAERINHHAYFAFRCNHAFNRQFKMIGSRKQLSRSDMPTIPQIINGMSDGIRLKGYILRRH
ncbi:MAG: hypothetical protein IJR65_01950 [Oscillospiraceae bacterium]|nr:hypothetical protein [Oscillospiraceae bacterium]